MTIAIALLAGFGIGIAAWFLAMHFVAKWLLRLADRDPAPGGSRALKAYELAACGLLVAVCLSLALWLSRLFWLQMKD